MQNRLLLVEVKNVLIQIDFDAKSTSTSRSEKCDICGKSAQEMQSLLQTQRRTAGFGEKNTREGVGLAT